MFLTGLVLIAAGTVFALLGARDLRNPDRAARHQRAPYSQMPVERRRQNAIRGAWIATIGGSLVALIGVILLLKSLA
jgi:membrane associated rhomboid family serine protease